MTPVLINAASGALRQRGGNGLAEAACARLAAAHPDAVVERLAPGDLKGRLTALAAEAPDRVVVAGGDGTVNTAIAAFAGTDTALGILPLGRMNLTARGLAIPLDPRDAVDALASAVPRRIDLAAVEDRIFAHHAGFGLPARTIHQRGAAGRWPVAVAAQDLWHRPPHLDLSIDGGRERRVALVAITNTLLTGDSDHAPGRQRLDAGRLGLYVVDRASRWGLLRLAAETGVGHWQDSQRLVASTARTVTVETRDSRLVVSLDGEVVRLIPPVRCRSLPAHLTVLVPPGFRP